MKKTKLKLLLLYTFIVLASIPSLHAQVGPDPPPSWEEPEPEPPAAPINKFISILIVAGIVFGYKIHGRKKI